MFHRKASRERCHYQEGPFQFELPKKEQNVLLYGLGFYKNRVYELAKVASAKDEIWAKYSEKTVGFKAALALENGSGEGDGEGDGEGTAGATTKKRQKAKIHSLPKPVAEALTDALKPWLAKDSTLPKPNKSDKRTEYGFTYEANGRTLYVQIFADKAD